MKPEHSLLQTILTCSVIIVVCGCATINSTPKNVEVLVSAIDPDMAEAVFRYQFEHNASGQQTNAAAYFLEFGNFDPDDAFISRFNGHNPPVKKRSQCSTKGMQVTDKKTGKPGLIFSIDKIVMTGPDTTEASGGYYEGGLSSSGNTYYLKRRNGKWFVEKDIMHWISHNSPNKGVDSYVSIHAASHPGLKRQSC